MQTTQLKQRKLAVLQWRCKLSERSLIDTYCRRCWLAGNHGDNDRCAKWRHIRRWRHGIRHRERKRPPAKVLGLYITKQSSQYANELDRFAKWCGSEIYTCTWYN